ncbi:MAG: helix-turn-helix transcriptional regulator [Verrucomicrobia bacterium]|nr:helix-turn-helix transcriptional regulator [Verrucomicrobiota bacterium]
MNKTIDWLILRLRRLRTDRRWTQEKFAEFSGISYKYYQAIEAGRKRELRLSTLERLAGAYGIEIHELLTPDSPATRPGQYSLAEGKRAYSASRKRSRPKK